MNAPERVPWWVMAWAKPEHSSAEVNAAAKIVVAAMKAPEAPADDWDEYWEALTVINNFRSSHAYPLNTFQVGLRKNCRRFDSNVLVAQRIKRLHSIWHKLDRFSSMRLSQIQDIGGCRAIVQNVRDVIAVHKYYVDESAIKHPLATCDDYIAKPKPSGYRGVHLVYRYFSDKTPKAIYNNLKIEVQLRSRYQHAWATAVETVGMFSGQALKSSLGSAEWQRFFALMAGAIAIREGKALVPGVPTNRQDLVRELRNYVVQLRVIERLHSYRDALKHLTGTGSSGRSAHFFLLRLDPVLGTLVVRGFRAGQAQQAAAAYSDAEQDAKKKPGTDAVLVSVESINALAKAYPNYFADTRLFVNLLVQTMRGRWHGLSTSVPAIAIPAGLSGKIKGPL